MMKTRQRLALAQVARYLGAAEIFRIVNLYARAGGSKTSEQSRHVGFVLRASFMFRLMIQDHDTHRRASVTGRSVPAVQNVQTVQTVQAVEDSYSVTVSFTLVRSPVYRIIDELLGATPH